MKATFLSFSFFLAYAHAFTTSPKPRARSAFATRQKMRPTEGILDSVEKEKREEFSKEVEAMRQLLDDESFDRIKQLTEEILEMRARKPNVKISPPIWDAIIKAMDLSKQYGKDSEETQTAWEAVRKTSLSEELNDKILKDAIHACNTFGELSHILSIEKDIVNRYGNTDFASDAYLTRPIGREDEMELWP